MSHIRIEVEEGEVIVPVGHFHIEASSRGMGYLLRTSNGMALRITKDEYTRIADILLRTQHD